jgi:hypothetical protein
MRKRLHHTAFGYSETREIGDFYKNVLGLKAAAALMWDETLAVEFHCPIPVSSSRWKMAVTSPSLRLQDRSPAGRLSSGHSISAVDQVSHRPRFCRKRWVI